MNDLKECLLEQAGCSTWKKMWMNLTGPPKADPHIYTPKMRVANKLLKDSTIIRKLLSYKKVIVVRHPIERLISAYLNKIHYIRGTYQFQKQVLGYVQSVRKSARANDIEWQEFV
ncbi:hypothetical protein SK128_006564, partial [Halocaridina rubra]